VAVDEFAQTGFITAKQAGEYAFQHRGTRERHPSERTRAAHRMVRGLFAAHEIVRALVPGTALVILRG